jgi:phage shock protein C
MFCRTCGQELTAGAQFCTRCGNAAGFGVANPAGAGRPPWDGLYRPLLERRLAGVCGAFAVRYGWDVTATRILTLVLGVIMFPVTEIAYLCGWMLLPEERPQPPVY